MRNYSIDVKTLKFLIIIFFLALSSCGQDKKFLNSFAESLYKENVCSKENYKKLLAEIDDGQIKSGMDVIKFFNYGTVIDRKNYSNAPDDYLKKVHTDVAKIFPGLSFSDFTFKVTIDSTISDHDSKFYDFVVSLKVNNKIYTQKSSYRLYSVKKNQYFGGEDFDPEMIDIFNKVLADQQSIYRLRAVDNITGFALDASKFGVVAVTKEQSKVIHNNAFLFFRLRYGSFKNTLTSESIESAIAEYQKLGLLNHLNDQQKLSSREIISQRNNIDFNDVLLGFPDVIYEFDMELANLNDPYAELIRKYSAISHGKFSPTEISDDFKIDQRQTGTLIFKLNGKEYSKTYKIKDDWIDPEIFQFMNGIVSENNIDGKFYHLYSGGQEARIIFLTESQHQELKRKNLLVFAEDWATQADE